MSNKAILKQQWEHHFWTGANYSIAGFFSRHNFLGYFVNTKLDEHLNPTLKSSKFINLAISSAPSQPRLCTHFSNSRSGHLAEVISPASIKLWMSQHQVTIYVHPLPCVHVHMIPGPKQKFLTIIVRCFLLSSESFNQPKCPAIPQPRY